jgi:hypothetical protein
MSPFFQNSPVSQCLDFPHFYFLHLLSNLHDSILLTPPPCLNQPTPQRLIMLGPLGQMVAGTSETMQVHFVKILET